MNAETATHELDDPEASRSLDLLSHKPSRRMIIRSKYARDIAQAVVKALYKHEILPKIETPLLMACVLLPEHKPRGSWFIR